MYLGNSSGGNNSNGSGNMNNRTSQRSVALSCMQEAYSVQREVIVRLRSSLSMLAGGDVIETERALLSDLCCQLGDWHLATVRLPQLQLHLPLR